MRKFAMLLFSTFAYSEEFNFEDNQLAIHLNHNLLLNIPIFRNLEKIKVTELGGCSNINYLSIKVSSRKDLQRAFIVLKKVHNSGFAFQGENGFKKIRDCWLFLEKSCSDDLNDYDFFLNTYSELRYVLEKDDLTKFPTYGDAILKNFLLIDNEIILIDWEYFSLNDQAWDFSPIFQKNPLKTFCLSAYK